ncbi:MAG: outer membrane beta-barrel protein [Beijerinckiaceae bacterium]|nr:outer membrane beta-barrel protein [Beijerinckiaceae bacterium]
MTCKDFSRKLPLALALAGFVSLAAAGYLPAPAAGADFRQPFPDLVPLDDRVEFASNWYVRGDIAYARETYPRITPTFSLAPSVLNTYSAGAGFGYKVNDWFRADLILDYRSEVRAAGLGPAAPCAILAVDPATGLPFTDFVTCNGRFNTEIHRWDLLANGYIDIGSWQGFTPYIGAGAGVTWARIWQSVNWNLFNGLPCQANCAIGAGNTFFGIYDLRQSAMTYHFAWALMAGVAFAVTDHVQLDVGYRFLDLGPVTGISSVTGLPVSQHFRANEVRGGLRYMID